MSNKNYSTAFTVDQTPDEAFGAIMNVRGWWGEGIEGGTEKLNDEFTYRHKDLHYSKQKLKEVVPGKKVVWLITEANLSFVENKSEWKGTEIVFEVAKKGNKTEVRVTHQGLVPEFECFDDCSVGWNHYIQSSLKNFITTGKGQPDEKAIGNWPMPQTKSRKS